MLTLLNYSSSVKAPGVKVKEITKFSCSGTSILLPSKQGVKRVTFGTPLQSTLDTRLTTEKLACGIVERLSSIVDSL